MPRISQHYLCGTAACPTSGRLSLHRAVCYILQHVGRLVAKMVVAKCVDADAQMIFAGWANGIGD